MFKELMALQNRKITMKLFYKRCIMFLWLVSIASEMKSVTKAGSLKLKCGSITKAGSSLWPVTDN